MYVIQIWSGQADPEIHRSFFVSTPLAMEACYRLLYDRVAEASMDRPDAIKWDYDGVNGVYIGTTEHSIDYEIYRLKPSG
jgi:hypothetical protein